LPWFPDVLRDDLTDMLQQSWTSLPPGAPSWFRIPSEIVLPWLTQALEETGSNKIVDLCSGGSGPWVFLSRQRELDGVEITLTDLYPNIQAFQRARALSNQRLEFVAQPVDATKCSIAGFRTMFASMHHLEPDLLAKILKDCVDKNQGFASFEQSARSWPFLLLLFFVHITLIAPLVFALTVKPFRWRRLYLLPIQALVSFHDGFVSGLRTYSKAEFLQLAHQVDPDGHFEWRVRQDFADGFCIPITAYVGVPKQKRSR
jgi:hypothetical protein